MVKCTLIARGTTVAIAPRYLGKNRGLKVVEVMWLGNLFLLIKEFQFVHTIYNMHIDITYILSIIYLPIRPRTRWQKEG